MKWIKNLESLAESNKPGKCPHCGSENTDYSATVINQDTKMGYMDIWCNDCKKAFHMSRMKIDDTMNTGKEIPNDLAY